MPKKQLEVDPNVDTAASPELNTPLPAAEAACDGFPVAASLKESAPASTQNVTLSLSDLTSLLAAASQQGKSDTKALVDAILESRKPYKDPNQERIMKNVRRKMREGLLREEANAELEQSRCSHLQGSRGRLPGQQTAIIMHTLDTGEVIGICLVCQRVFRSCDMDYQQQLTRPSGCQPSQSGRRPVVDLRQAIELSQEGHKRHDAFGRVKQAAE